MNNRLYTEIAVYSIQVQNLLVAERVAEDQYIGRNAGKTDHNGVEFLLLYNTVLIPGIDLRSFVNASFNSFQFDQFVEEGVDFSGNELPAVPDKSIHAGLDFLSAANVDLNITFEHEGKMALNDENSLYTDSYNLVHLKTSFSPQVLENWETEIFVGINNALDEHYAASVIPNAVGFGGAAPRYYYPGNPRNYFTGILISYSF